MSRHTRRQFFKKILFILVGWVFPLNGPFNSSWRKAWGEILNRVPPRGKTANKPISASAENLEVNRIEITSLKDFGTMGLSDHKVDIRSWTLDVTGLVSHPLRFSHKQIRALPSIERKVLLVCPGFFSNRGIWKGISIKTLLEKVKVDPATDQIIASGPKGIYVKMEEFPLKDILSDKVFLAYQVNGVDLPEKHGFPLRLVAEGYNGDTWVKYVDKLEVRKI